MRRETVWEVHERGFQEILSRITFDQKFVNTGGKTLQLERDEHVDVTATARNSLAKSLLYHLRNLSPDAITDQFDGVRDRLFEVLRSQRRLPAFVDVAIDLHEWRFYGSADTDQSGADVKAGEREAEPFQANVR